MKRLAVVFLGSRGGGVDDTYGILSALSNEEAFNISCILSKNNENLKSFRDLLPKQLTFVDTGGFSLVNLFKKTLTFRWLPILKTLKFEKPDFILITMMHPWCIFVFLYRFMVNRQVKILYVRHNPKGFQSNASMLNGLITKLDDIFTLWADRIITYSKYMMIKTKRDFAREDVFNIGFGIYKNYPSIERNLRNSTLSVLFFGRILEYKGIDTLLDSIVLLERNNTPVRVIIAGEGDISSYNYHPSLKSKMLDIRNRWISNEELLQLLGETDILVAPYKTASQSGPVNIAVASGVPLIVTNVGGAS